MDVCVLGAGIVGLACAYELERQGARVTVVDRGNPGTGASGGNGAQLSYSYVQPLADQSIWGQLPKLLTSSDSPLKIRPQWDLAQWRWGLAFLRACNAQTSSRTTAVLLQLAALSRNGLERMRALHEPDCDFSSTGKLVLYPNATSFSAAQRQMELQRALGSQQSALSAHQACELEPALSAYIQNMAGAIYTPSECALDCLKLCQELERILRLRGVQFALGEAVSSLETRQNQIVAVRTATQTIQADHFVLALGSDSPRLARSVGVHLPVYPIKGYSLTLDVGEVPVKSVPRINVTDIASKVVFARIGSRLRVAGMAELVGHDHTVHAHAIANLQRRTRILFPALSACKADLPWTGLRPATPTGLPVVGVQTGGPRNLMINTGHGGLGLTLAFGTAHQVTQHLLGQSAS